MKIDHVVVLVSDLDIASADWRDRGFTVTPGGVHAGGLTHNALVCYRDGSYVELIAFRGEDAGQHPWARYRGYWGPIDFALAVEDVDATVRELGAKGLTYDAPYDGGRVRADGVQLRWRGAMPAARDAGLPFLIQDVTPRELRVPAGDEATLHANAASGIAQLRIDVPSLTTVEDAFETLFGEPEEDQHRLGFRLQGSRVSVTQPAPDSAEAAFIARRGPGPLALTIAAPVPIVIKPAALQTP